MATAAAKSFVGLLFVLIVLSANSQMASATGVSCTSDLGVSLGVLTGCVPATCTATCYNYCTVKLGLNVNAATCVLGLISLGVSSCNCCCVTL
ncbi:hypothetical protein BVC80_551g63 [Macleaya cordata]|uniref:Uncharacterized protein n=1 Tax=Macleaya cordata TaxID=56857 RepID=A0A200QE52_MACCD|nr:hypothetical protein BVC80_551g63 [Macleaya cordata]